MYIKQLWYYSISPTHLLFDKKIRMGHLKKYGYI